MFRGCSSLPAICCGHARWHAALLAPSAATAILPDVSHQPVIHNPFPQLSRVAVAPFFNQSDEPTVDGRKFALAYFAELQAVPGFEVVPLGVVEEAIIRPSRRFIAMPAKRGGWRKILGVDAVVIGSVTDYTPYYPPRCGMRVEWYAANPGFHEIPPGYGLPWGTPEEEFIPAPLVFEAEMALAQAQMATQTPICEPPLPPAPTPTPSQDANGAGLDRCPWRRRQNRQRRLRMTPAEFRRRCTASGARLPWCQRGRAMQVRREKRLRNTKKSCRPALRTSGSRRSRCCNRTRLPRLVRPVRSARTAHAAAGLAGRARLHSAAARARCDRPACRTMVRL